MFNFATLLGGHRLETWDMTSYRFRSGCIIEEKNLFVCLSWSQRRLYLIFTCSAECTFTSFIRMHLLSKHSSYRAIGAIFHPFAFVGHFVYMILLYGLYSILSRNGSTELTLYSVSPISLTSHVFNISSGFSIKPIKRLILLCFLFLLFLARFYPTWINSWKLL